MRRAPLYLQAAQAAAATRRAAVENAPSLALDGAELARLELLLAGLFTPLRGYLSKADYHSVLAAGRLADGTLWPLPLSLALGPEQQAVPQPGQRLALRDGEGVLLALLDVEETWPDGERLRLAGPVRGVAAPAHDDFPTLRRLPPTAPTGPRLGLALAGPLLHRHRHAAARAAALGGELLAMICAGAPAIDDHRHYALLRCLDHAVRRCLPDTQLCVLPLAPARDDAGRLLTALVMRNLGCSHLLAEPDWRAALQPHRRELGLEPCYLPAPDADDEQPLAAADLAADLALLAPRAGAARAGFTVFFTGLSGAGKSTIARALLSRLLRRTRRSVTLLDGDRVRRQLSAELGFSKRDRDRNVARIGYVASEISKHGGIAICAPIAPYAATRDAVRAMVEDHGGFVEVHVATPLEVCERRDRKGLYAKARAGLIGEFTGVSDPYETPSRPELRVDAASGTPAEAAERVLAKLADLGYLSRQDDLEPN